MNRVVAFALVALVCLVGASSAGAAGSNSASVRCVYKMSKLPVYMQLRGLPSAAMCDIVGGGADGSAVKVYGNPAGAPRCAFRLELGVTNTIYSPSSVYGPMFCKLFSKSSGVGKRIF